MMCDFDDFYDDGFEDDFGDEFDNDLGNDVGNDAGDECEGICFGDDLADFAILGGFIGYLEEEIKERKRLEREMKKEQERIDREMTDCDIFNPPDDEEFLP